MSRFQWGSYVSVGERRAKAAREVVKLQKKDKSVSPVVVEGRKIASNFWGKAWCENLERYSDYENRLPRGRSYVCNGLIVDLRIERGKIAAKVSGSSLYDVNIDIRTVGAAHWAAICRDCAGSVGSLVELLSGKLSKNVMERVCREGDGLFPSPKEIKLSCSCPDWAGMCKHVAAAMYGVGARLDAQPDLLFALRGVDRAELIATAGADLPMTQSGAKSRRVLAEDDVAALFGVEMAPEPAKVSKSAKPSKTATTKASLPREPAAAEVKAPRKRKAAAPPPVAPPPVVEARPRKTATSKAAAPAKRPAEKARRAAPAKPAVEAAAPAAEPKSRRERRGAATGWRELQARKRR